MTFEGCRVGKFLVVVIELVRLNCVECEESVDQLEETGDWKLRWEKTKIQSPEREDVLLVTAQFEFPSTFREQGQPRIPHLDMQVRTLEISSAR